MAEPKELGTLIVVVGKARNLPNKSRFGKQDPFCTVKIGNDKQRTKAIKRGGQHPEWDEELRFSLFEDVDDVLTRSDSQGTSLSSSSSQPPLPPKDQPGVITSAALASKSRLGPVGKKGGKSMRIACYADDAKEPELIGECVVNFDEVLKKGEVDEWYEFSYKEKYSGEVYLELTYYSNDVPPIRRNVPRPAVNYGGAGVFDPASSASLGGRRPAGLSTSGSVSGMSLYIPPYVQQGRTPSPGPLLGSAPGPTPAPSSSFMELGLPPGHGRKQSLPQTLPGRQPYVSPTSAFDAITNDLSTMSLGQSYSSRPLPSATAVPQPQPETPYHHNSRHSLSGSVDAPWSHQVQAQLQIPHSRPVSTGWDQVHREDDRRMATPVARPLSQSSYPGSYGNGPQYSSATPQPMTEYRVPSPIPTSLLAAGPPRPDYNHHPASHLGLPPSGAAYRAPSPSPTPPMPSHTAPPMNSNGHYQTPSSSFGGQQQQTAPTQSGYYPPAVGSDQYQPNRYQQPPTFANDQYQTNGYLTGQHQISTPSSYPSQQEYSYIHPPPTRPAPGASTTDYRQPTPAPAAIQSEYVPWYQQTSNAAPPPNSNRPEEAYMQSQTYPKQQDRPYDTYQTTGSYSTAQPPGPAPPPPPPPRPQTVGYYPSDELYVQQRSTTPQPVQQRPTTPQPRPSTAWNPSLNASDSYQATQPVYAAPAPQAGWQSNTQPYGRAPSPAPPARPANSDYYPQQHPEDAHRSSIVRSPSPYAPPQNGWAQPPSTLIPPRSHSPLPLPSHVSPSPSQPFSHSHQTSQSSTTSKSDWRGYLQSLGTGSSSDQPLSQSQPQFQSQSQPQSYGQYGDRGADGRSSPLPPSQYGQAPPSSSEKSYYVPLPSLPSSIRPPEGWRSTLPAESSGHHWGT